VAKLAGEGEWREEGGGAERGGEEEEVTL